MAANRRDVELVIKARNEASKAIDSVADALTFLATSQQNVAAGSGKVSTNLVGLKSALSSVQAAYGKIDREADAASAAFERQGASLAATRGEYEAVTAQIESARQALAKLRSQKAPDFIGPVNVPQIKAAEAAYRDLLSQESKLTANIGRQEQALQGARTALQQLGSTANAAEAALEAVGSDAHRAAIIAQAEAFERAEREAAQYRREIVRLAADEAARANDQFFGIRAKPANSARESAAVFEEAARAENEMAAAAASLRARIDPLGAAQAHLNVELAKARDLYRAGRITANELASAEALLAKNADQAARALARTPDGKGSFLGLQPYELTNLSFQINDVFTQLASGTSLTQTLAQQGGQVFQIFGRQITGILPMIARFVPLVGGVIAVVGTLKAALNELSDQKESTRQFASILAASADGLAYQGTALAETARQLDVYGASLKDAREATAAFIKDGIAPEQIERFGVAAINMARVFKTDLPDAVKKTAEAFSSGYNAVRSLDDSLDFLTAAEREQIKAMFDSGQAAEARSLAFRIFEQKMDSAADKARGPWSKAFRDLGSAWRGFVGFLSETAVIQNMSRNLGDLAAAAENLASKLPGAVSGVTSGTGSPEIVRLEERLLGLRQDRAKAAAEERDADTARMRLGIAANGRLTGGRPAADVGKRITAIDTEILVLEDQLRALKQAMGDTIRADSEAALKARQDQIGLIDREADGLGDLTDAQKVLKAGEVAYREEIRATGDLIIAQARQRLAMAKERDRQEKAISYSRLAGKIVGIESGGDPSAKNARSSATGAGQFIESTWLRMFKQHFPSAADMSDAQILARRKNPDDAAKMVELYARENAAVLKAAGHAVTEANLYLAHFLGASGAKKVLSARPAAPVSGLLSPDAIASNPTILKGKTAGQVVGFAERKVGQSDQQRAALEAVATVQERLNTDAKEFNQTLDERLAGWRAEAIALADLADQERLTTEAKYAAKRAAEIALEVGRAEREATERSQVFSAERRAEIEATVGALFDLQHAEAMHNEILRQKRDFISDTVGLEQQRRALLQQLSFAVSQGETEEAGDLRDQIEAIRLKLLEAVPEALRLARALGDEKSVATLERVVLTMQTVREQVLSTRQANEMLAGGLVNAFDRAAQAIGEGENAIKSMGNAFRSFASDFLRQMAMMILKTQLLKLLAGAFGGASGGVGGIIAGAVNGMAGATSHHTGGLAGSGPVVWRPAAIWNNVVRYHDGGIAGLKPNEVPAVLKRNEEVLTETDPRHRFNVGGAAQANADVKVVNLFDASELVSAAMNTREGQQVIINVLRKNASGVRSAIGVAG